MPATAVKTKEEFRLHMSGFQRELNGVLVDEKSFSFRGLVFETEARPPRGDQYSVTLRILQDGVELTKRHCDSFSVTFREPDIVVITWSAGAMGKTHGEIQLVPGWKVGENWAHHPDTQC